MYKFLLTGIFFLQSITPGKVQYPWTDHYSLQNTISERIKAPDGYTRIRAETGSFADWLKHLPLKPENAPVKYWNGKLKSNQNAHYAVIDIDFIGNDLQQCVDAIIRLRSEYLRSVHEDDKIQFSYTCCNEKISWEKWKAGWRTKIVKKNGVDTFEWIKSAGYDDSGENFRKYLYNIMMYAGTMSLSRDMKRINASDVKVGDAYVQGGAPGYGHGVIILDMAISSKGEKIMLLGQSYSPAENINVLKSNQEHISPWFKVEFGSKLYTPQWVFTSEHARRFE